MKRENKFRDFEHIRTENKFLKKNIQKSFIEEIKEIKEIKEKKKNRKSLLSSIKNSKKNIWKSKEKLLCQKKTF